MRAELDGGRRAQVHLVGAVGKAQPARAREGREERRVLRDAHRAVRLDAPVDEALHSDGYVRLGRVRVRVSVRVRVRIRVRVRVRARVRFGFGFGCGFG